MESTTVAGALIFLMISGVAGVLLLRSGDGGLRFLDRLYNTAPHNRPARRGR
jgi:hypothetical protein